MLQYGRVVRARGKTGVALSRVPSLTSPLTSAENTVALRVGVVVAASSPHVLVWQGSYSRLLPLRW